MTPQEGEKILDIVSAALQWNDDQLPYSPKSQLRGYDVFEVDAALKLRIATDFLILARNGREAEIESRAAQWATIPQHVILQFIDDEELAQFRELDRDSMEYHELVVELSPAYVDAAGKFGDPRLAKLETLDSFAKYCRYVGAADPLYWQKIYTRVDLPYTKTCPSVNEPVLLD